MNQALLLHLPTFQGSYAGLDGGSSLWAFTCLTGNYACKFKLEGTSWKRYELEYPKGKDSRSSNLMLRSTPDSLTSDEMFQQLMYVF